MTDLKKKSTIESFSNRLDQAEERMSEHEDKSFKFMGSKEKNEWKRM